MPVVLLWFGGMLVAVAAAGLKEMAKDSLDCEESWNDLK